MADNNKSHLNSAAHPEKQQELVRSELRTRAEVKQIDTKFTHTILVDVSTSGFRFYSHTSLNQHKPLMIKLTGLETLQASIIWYKDGYHGCKFARPLCSTIFQHIVSKLRLDEI